MSAASGKKRATTKKKAARKPAAKKKAAKRKRAVRRKRVDPEWRDTVLARLADWLPHAECALDHSNPFELTAATILSAQCTDERVNMVTPALFARYPTPEELASSEQEDVEEIVRSTGFFRNKAKNLRGMAQRVVDAYDGQIPREMDDLLTLPGVARKTANVVRGVCWGLADGVVVDTHVKRISRRLGFTNKTDPVQVERDLVALLPQEAWIDYSHRIIHLGRRICDARKPLCDECFLADGCPRVDV